MFMSSLWFRTVSLAATLTVSVVAGTYCLVKLGHECASADFLPCIQKSVFRSPSEPPTVATEPPKKMPRDAPRKTSPGPTAAPQPTPQQDPAREAMLISTGYLDGEVGRIAKSDFDKAVKAFQAALGRDGVGGELSATQRKALQGRFESARAAWQLRKVPDAQGFELSLPARLLSEGRRLKYGRRYTVDNGDFSIDVAQFPAPDWTLEKLEDQHCCRNLPTRTLESTTIAHVDGDVRGFILSALDGKERISVRAFQKDDVIRLLAITYNVERDSEYRSLRNAIASSYVPFASAKADRVASCASDEPNREACNEKPDGKSWQSTIYDPK
jgi:hypothetical protein